MTDWNSESTGARLAFAKSRANAKQMPNLLILGASVRAAAWSALGSGTVQPCCIDLFADADLQRQISAQAIPLSAYPYGFLEASRRAPPGPWLYTGALENYPDLIEAIAANGHCGETRPKLSVEYVVRRTSPSIFKRQTFCVPL